MNLQASVYDETMDQSPSPKKQSKSAAENGLEASNYRSPDEEIGGYQAAKVNAEDLTNRMHQVVMIEKTACKRKQPLFAPGTMKPKSPSQNPLAQHQQQPGYLQQLYSPQKWGQQNLHEGFGSGSPRLEHELQQSGMFLGENPRPSLDMEDETTYLNIRDANQGAASQMSLHHHHPFYSAAQFSALLQPAQLTNLSLSAHGGTENQQLALHNPRMDQATMFKQMSEKDLQRYVSTHPLEVLRPLSRVEVSSAVIQSSTTHLFEKDWHDTGSVRNNMIMALQPQAFERVYYCQVCSHLVPRLTHVQ